VSRPVQARTRPEAVVILPDIKCNIYIYIGKWF
jgi:hypothetical protein